MRRGALPAFLVLALGALEDRPYNRIREMLDGRPGKGYPLRWPEPACVVEDPEKTAIRRELKKTRRKPGTKERRRRRGY